MKNQTWHQNSLPASPAKGRFGQLIIGAAALCVIVFAVRAYIGVPTASGMVESLPLYIALLLGAWYFAAKGLGFDRRTMLAALGIFVAGMVIRILLLPGESQDYDWFLKVWVQQFRDEGLQGFAGNKANYNVLYLYYLYGISKLPVGDLAMIKLFSVVGDVALTLAGARMAVRLVHPSDGTAHAAGRKLYVTALAVFWFLPTFWLNSAWWGQCDSLYGALCLIALLLALEDRPVLSVVAATLAFAFKLQAVFFLPIYVVLLMVRKVKVWHALIFPAAMAAVTLPALLAGMSLERAFGVYFRQAEEYKEHLNLNASSVYGLIQRSVDTDLAAKAGIFAAVVFVSVVWVVSWFNRKRLDDRMLVFTAFLLCLGIPYLLPHMHDRYFYLPEMLAMLVVLYTPRRWYLGVMTWIGSYAGYHAYIFRRYLVMARFRMGVPALVMGLGLILAIGWWIMDLRRMKTQDYRSARK